MDKMRDNRPRWFRDEMKRKETKAVRVVIKMNVEGKKRKRRPKKR